MGSPLSKMSSFTNPPDPVTSKDLGKLLSIIQNEILPKTEMGVQNGNKVFGAAILQRDSLNTVIADTNEETKCPLYHGEVNVIKKWSEMQQHQRGSAENSVFLSTHEPCCMCISAIVWAGFKTVFYLFPYETTKDQGIPHDLDIMHELWGVERYRRKNKYCQTFSIMEHAALLKNQTQKRDLLAKFATIETEYNRLASDYHANKGENENDIAFG